ncbi:MAG: HAD family hydrolase [Candidatus Pristimantibacillus sp.]
MIKAIIFDFDGTILDTETAWYYAFRDAYKEHGVDLTLDLYSQCIGTSLHQFNPYEYLMTELKLPIDKQLFKQSVHDQHSALMNQEQIRPGIIEYLNLAKESGLKIGLASSSSIKWVEKYLNQLGIRDYFECIRTSEDVVHVKPDPELYIQALKGLGVDASEAIAIEDSPNGARAAAAAGMHCIVVPNAITKLLSFDEPNTYHQGECLTHIDLNKMLVGSL